MLRVGREHHRDNLSLVAETFRKQRSDRTVDEAAGENFLLGKASFALDEATREFAGRVSVFAVIDSQWEKTCARLWLLRGSGSDQHHRISRTNNDRTIGLFGNLAGLDRDL